MSDRLIENYLKDFSSEEIDEVKKLLEEDPTSSMKDLEDELYKVKPPSPSEFLESWIGDDTRDSLYPHVKKDFIEMWDPDNNYHEAIFYGGTGTGKSLLAVLCIVYCIVRMWCLKDPHKFYNLSSISPLAIYIMCFSKVKAMQLLLAPIENALKRSPKFHYVLYEERLDSTQKQLGTEKIVWTTASKVGEIQFFNDLHICLGASPLDIIGANIIMAVISEINFFIESIGVSDEDVWRVFTDSKDRIESRVAKKYGSMIILDSSANNKDCRIERYIIEEASKNPEVFYRAYKRWEAVPDRFPIWNKSKKTFDVFIGDSMRPPCIVDDKFNALPGDDRRTIKVPIDALETFKKNIFKSLKDLAGIATSSDNLFFPDMGMVSELLFDYNLENVRRPVEAPLKQNPDDLIFNKVYDVFMQKSIDGKWVLKRAKSAPRWIRVDLSETSDRTGIAMIHPEIRDDGSIVGVYDFAFDIKPTKDGINLEAIKEFVRSLYLKYYIYIAGVSTDKYQSSFIAQSIKRDEKVYKLISVDSDKSPYLVYKSKMLNNCLKVGYYENIYNNLRSLIETPHKIDHIQIRDKSFEKNKEIGYESKDITDAKAGCCFDMFQEISKYPIKYNYDDINRSIDHLKQLRAGGYSVSKMESAVLLHSLIDNIKSRNVDKDKLDELADKIEKDIKDIF